MYSADVDISRVDSFRPYISIGTGIDSTVIDDIGDVTAGMLEMSNVSQILDATYTMTPGLATYEADGIPTAADGIIIAPPIAPMPAPPHTGIWSDVISDGDGAMDWTMSITVSQPHTSAMTVYGDPEGVTVDRVRFRYYLDGTVVRDVTIDRDGTSVMDKVSTTYDRVDLTVLLISAPYCHARISEVEFGASHTVAPEMMGEELIHLRDVDIYGLTSPLYELNFSLLNVDGLYDIDHPDSRISTVALGTPVILSVTMEEGGRSVTVPLGRYYIIEHNSIDDLLEITAMDARIILADHTTPVVLDESKPISTSIYEVLSALGIPHVIDNGVGSVYPVRGYTPDEPTDVLTQLNYIAQRYNINVVPDRDGNLRVCAGMHTGTAPPLTMDTLIDYPKPSFARTYNYLTIYYGSMAYSRDLRTGGSDEAILSLNVRNPLIATEAEASDVADTLQARMYAQEYRANAVADPRIDVLDTMPMEGRWTHDAPLDYTVASVELVYDGGMTMRVTGVR